jgi:TorA maturation chaperone TorD
MARIAEDKQIRVSRAGLYRWLSRLYRAEVDRTLLDQLRAMRDPEGCRDADLRDGYRLLRDSLQDEGGRDLLDDLAADYAKVFLGAGHAKGSEAAAFPFASVYTSPKRIVMQEARDRAVQAYARRGLRSGGIAGVPEDHLALLLAFMAILVDDAPAAEQLDFLQQHLLNWVPAFCSDLEKHAATPFYRSIGKITSGWLRLDSRCLEGGLTCGLCS